jgi:LuxR family maltose regulon positive regulatory protein
VDLRRPVAWLSLDASRQRPARFWRHAIAALDRVRPGIAERVASLLGPPAPASFEGLLTALINALAGDPDEGGVVLVVDDYHEIDSEAVHTSITFLLEHRPPELRLILTSRADPPLPLARLRGRAACRLRAADRASTEEAAARWCEAVGPDLPLADASVAVGPPAQRVAGLRLAAVASGTIRRVRLRDDIQWQPSLRLDYLTEEVLER